MNCPEEVWNTSILLQLFFLSNIAFFVSTYVDLKSRYAVAMIYVRGL